MYCYSPLQYETTLSWRHLNNFKVHVVMSYTVTLWFFFQWELVSLSTQNLRLKIHFISNSPSQPSVWNWTFILPRCYEHINILLIHISQDAFLKDISDCILARMLLTCWDISLPRMHVEKKKITVIPSFMSFEKRCMPMYLCICVCVWVYVCVCVCYERYANYVSLVRQKLNTKHKNSYSVT